MKMIEVKLPKYIFFIYKIRKCRILHLILTRKWYNPVSLTTVVFCFCLGDKLLIFKLKEVLPSYEDIIFANNAML